MEIQGNQERESSVLAFLWQVELLQEGAVVPERFTRHPPTPTHPTPPHPVCHAVNVRERDK